MTGRPSSVRPRLRQGITGLRPRIPRERDRILITVLTPSQIAAFVSLSTYDQQHLLRVYQRLREGGAMDRDLLIAALLHDIGKWHPKGQIRLAHRVMRVVLGRFAPRVLNRLSSQSAKGWRRGFALAVHHPRLGAERAADLGCSPRVCWLIAHHEDDSAAHDPELQRLMLADRTTL